MRRRRRQAFGEGVSAGGGATAHNSVNAPPTAYESEDFTSYANYAAALAAWTTRFDVQSYVADTGFAFDDSTVLFNGHRTLKGTQQNNSQFERGMTLPPGTTNAWMRTMFYLSAAHQARGWLFFNALAESFNENVYIFGSYNDLGANNNRFKKPISNTTGTDSFTIASLRGSWHSHLLHAEVIAGHPKATTFLDGVVLDSEYDVGKNLTEIGFLDLDFNDKSTDATADDPTNSHFHVGRWDLDLTSDPFGLRSLTP